MGRLDEEEMWKTFNMGVGLVIIAPKESDYMTKSFIKNQGGSLKAFNIGEIIKGERGVDIE